jgi:hypothetical protein
MKKITPISLIILPKYGGLKIGKIVQIIYITKTQKGTAKVSKSFSPPINLVLR